MRPLPPLGRFDSSTGVRIYRIPCQVMPEFSGRVYLLLGAGPPTLVDTGSGGGLCTVQILAGMEQVRTQFGESFRIADLKRILITHAHYDHIGGLAELVHRTGAKVGVHVLDRRWINAWDERAVLHNRAVEGFFEVAGVPLEARAELIQAFGVLPGRVQSVPVSIDLREQEDLDRLHFLHIPGHSPGHIAIRIGDVLLCGDHVLPRTVPQQWPESLAPFTGLGHYLESLDKIEREQGIRLALGGHEPPIENLSQRITEIRTSHRRRLDRLLGILRNAPRPLTIHEATEQMYSHSHGFQALLALTDVGSRIEYLDQRGHLEIVNIRQIESGEEHAYRYRPGSAQTRA